MGYIEQNLYDVINKIEKAAIRSGRKLEDITLIAVTKTVELYNIKKVLDNNIFNLGENRVNELLFKHENLKNNVNWHMIGHLQTNKVKYVIGKVNLIHSVDSIKLAEEINKYAEAKSLIIDVLVQINISNEKTKYGIEPQNAKNFIIKISKLNNIRVKGLMTIAPFVEKPHNNREYFKQMYLLYIDINTEFINNIDMKYISMGMTNDYEIAIEEGSNMVRIGTGIFGPRNKDT